MKHKFLACLVWLFAFYFCSAFGKTPGTWITTGSMNSARYFHTATLLLASNQVLVAGGSNSSIDMPNSLSSAEVYNIATGVWTSTGAMNVAREQYTATVLSNNEVLVTGGYKDDSILLSSAEIYNPIYATWTSTGSMNIARGDHTATLLSNGQVLVTGGGDSARNPSIYYSSTELYNPATNMWTIVQSMGKARARHIAILLPSGSVLVAGGQTTGGAFLASAEIYNPETGVWTSTGSMNIAREEFAATLLPNNQVLVVGGYNNSGYLASAEIYNPDTGMWKIVSSLGAARANHITMLLKNNQVLVAGGGTSGIILPSAELYTPNAGTWTSIMPMSIPRGYHTATLLPNGQILVVGGWDGTTASASAELYDYAPILNSFSKSIYENRMVNFTANDFSNNFIAVKGGCLSKVRILNLPTNGILKLLNTEVIVNQTIAVNDLENLTFTPTLGWIGVTSFSWNGSDGDLYATTPANVNIAVNDQPPVITNVNKSIHKDNIITFSSADFTNSFKGYCDNSLAKISILLLPTYGVLKLSDNIVAVNQEISTSDLGKLTYTPTTGYVGTDSFGWNGTDGTMYSTSSANVNIILTDNTSDNSQSWTNSAGGIATICGSAVGGIASILGAGYTIYKCKQDGACCFGRREPGTFATINHVPLVEAQPEAKT